MRKKRVYHGMKGERIIIPSEGAKKLKSPTPLTNVRYDKNGDVTYSIVLTVPGSAPPKNNPLIGLEAP